MRGLHVVQALKKYLPSDVGGRRPPGRVHIADGQFNWCCADVRRHDRRQQHKCADLVRRRVELCSKPAHGMGDDDRRRIEAACNFLDVVDDVGDRHLHEQVIVDRCRTAATTPVEGVNLVAGGRVDSGMFLPAPRCVATTVHADQRRPLRRVFRRSGESFDANSVDVILIVIDTGHSRNGVDAARCPGDDDDFPFRCHVRSFSRLRVYPSE